MIEVGSDSIMISYDSTKESNVGMKLYQIGDLVVGTVGSAAECGLFKEFIRKTKPTSATEAALIALFSKYHKYLADVTNDPTVKVENDFVLVFDNKVFVVSGYFVREVSSHAAIGAGSDLALGALAAGADVEQALGIACDHSIRCARPISLIRIPRKKLLRKGNSSRSR